MRTPRFVALGVLAGTLAVAAPHTTHAAGYSHFTSTTYGYSIDYPSTWKKTASGPTQIFSNGGGNTNYEVVSVVAVVTGKPTLATLTSSNVNAYKKRGFTVSKITYAGGLSIFSAQGSLTGKGRTIIETAAGAHAGKGYVLTVFAPPSLFKDAANTYLHMLKTFNAR